MLVPSELVPFEPDEQVHKSRQANPRAGQPHRRDEPDGACDAAYRRHGCRMRYGRLLGVEVVLSVEAPGRQIQVQKRDPVHRLGREWASCTGIGTTAGQCCMQRARSYLAKLVHSGRKVLRGRWHCKGEEPSKFQSVRYSALHHTQGQRTVCVILCEHQNERQQGKNVPHGPRHARAASSMPVQPVHPRVN